MREIIRDSSDHGFRRLATNDVVESVNAQGEILNEVQLSPDEAAEIRALADLSGKEVQIGRSNNLFQRDCPLTYCINTSDCPASCPAGCMIVCTFIPITGTNQCNIGVCLENS